MQALPTKLNRMLTSLPTCHLFRCKRLELASNREKMMLINACSVRYGSFAQDLALGKLNLEWLFPYPMFKTREDFEEIDGLSDTVAKFFEERVDSVQVDLQAKISDEVMQDIKDMGLFGLQVPVEYGGLGLNNLQYAHIVQQLTRDGSIYTILSHHLMAVKALMLAGNDIQIEKILPQFSSGTSIGGFCFSESPDGLDAQQIESYAHLDEEGLHWILNGEKECVVNANFAGTFIVFAKTKLLDISERQVEKVTAFIVERDRNGVSIGKPNNQIGLRASGACTVSFDNAQIPIENVLGEVGKGYKIAMDVMNKSRFVSGCYGSGLLKNLIKPVCDHTNERQQFGTKLADFGLIQKKITNMTCEAYAMESMAFIVANQLDRASQSYDCSIEAAIIKIYSSESVWKATSETLQVFGGLGYMTDYPYERILRDSSSGLVAEGPNFLLKLYVALSSLKFAAKQLEVQAKNLYKTAETYGTIAGKLVKKHVLEDQGNLDYYPWDRVLYHPETQRTEDDISLQFLHPDLHECGKIVEHCVESYLTRLICLVHKHGKKLPANELSLEKVADISIKIFAMSAVMARSNKSILLRLPNCQNDLHLANHFIKTTFRDLRSLLEETNVDFCEDYTPEKREISQKTMKDQQYLFSHPLEVLHRYFEHPKYLKSLDNLKSLPQ